VNRQIGDHVANSEKPGVVKSLVLSSYSLFVPDMTYNVFGGTLNLAQSINCVL